MRKLCSKLLLTSALVSAGAISAQAADLPATKAAPIEYVRVCGAYGAGFFYIPGTDTCLRVSGRARAEFGYQQNFMRTTNNYGDATMWRTLMRLNIDARTQTSYGTLRAFLRWEAGSRSGIFLYSGTLIRRAAAFAATGQDQNGRLQQFLDVEKAFVQFAGFTAGRASSFFDFYAHDFEIIGVSSGSDVPSTNLIAYTAKVTNEISATLSMEDPMFRKTGIYAGATGGVTPFTSQIALTFNAAGIPTGGTTLDVIERNRMPDFVGVLRYDAAWGSAQLSGAVKDLNVGGLSGTYYGAASAANFARRVDTEYGYGVQAGVKINLPQIAPGDALYLQAAYGSGAVQYSGVQPFTGGYTTFGRPFQGSNYSIYLPDATLNPLTGKLQNTDSFTAVASYLHYWTPEWRSAFFGSYGQLDYAKGARFAQGLANVGNVFGTAIGTVPNPTVNINTYRFSETLRDWSQVYVGGSLIWSPVKDLDIGVEGVYTNYFLKGGSVVDQNKSTGATVTALNALGQPIGPSGAVIRTVNSQDTFQVRMRVQRDF